MYLANFASSRRDMSSGLDQRTKIKIFNKVNIEIDTYQVGYINIFKHKKMYIVNLCVGVLEWFLKVQHVIDEYIEL